MFRRSDQAPFPVAVGKALTHAQRPTKPRTAAPDGSLASSSLPIGSRLIEVLKLHYRANRPFLLEGHTGVGKSDLVEQVARDLGIACVVLNLSLLEPPDLLGVPFQRDGRTVYAPPSILPTTGQGLLFLEELNRAERCTQNPALLLLTARRLHEYVLPAG